MIEDFSKRAADAYSRILTRYPMMERADDAKLRLQALHQPVPRPTKAAVAQNKAEEESRRTTPMYKQVMRTFNKHPDTAPATKVGDPTLVDPPMSSATEVAQQANRAMIGNAGSIGNNSVAVEAVGKGGPPPDQPAPRSDVTPSTSTTTATDAPAPAPAASSNANELKPNVAADPNELKPNVASDGSQAMPPPQQVNEIQAGGSGQNATGDGTGAASSSSQTSSSQTQDDDTASSSSKHKKKKGLRKIVPF
jgi:hypothetical protein